ncbi:hypothetical protein EYC80_001368 [Monilinia laxa]|uniref:Uncharacterized protein n=1 Tax=Monilinia laxa TaxID=61186 RepID=A0A5N6KA03_MONLA|nr:hypothetical protein EYC80_001368 [Monilinia laxa]
MASGGLTDQDSSQSTKATVDLRGGNALLNHFQSPYNRLNRDQNDSTLLLLVWLWSLGYMFKLISSSFQFSFIVIYLVSWAPFHRTGRSIDWIRYTQGN